MSQRTRKSIVETSTSSTPQRVTRRSLATLEGTPDVQTPTRTTRVSSVTKAESADLSKTPLRSTRASSVTSETGSTRGKAKATESVVTPQKAARKATVKAVEDVSVLTPTRRTRTSSISSVTSDVSEIGSESGRVTRRSSRLSGIKLDEITELPAELTGRKRTLSVSSITSETPKPGKRSSSGHDAESLENATPIPKNRLLEFGKESPSISERKSRSLSLATVQEDGKLSLSTKGLEEIHFSDDNNEEDAVDVASQKRSRKSILPPRNDLNTIAEDETEKTEEGGQEEVKASPRKSLRSADKDVGTNVQQSPKGPKKELLQKHMEDSKKTPQKNVDDNKTPQKVNDKKTPEQNINDKKTPQKIDDKKTPLIVDDKETPQKNNDDNKTPQKVNDKKTPQKNNDDNKSPQKVDDKKTPQKNIDDKKTPEKINDKKTPQKNTPEKGIAVPLIDARATRRSLKQEDSPTKTPGAGKTTRKSSDSMANETCPNDGVAPVKAKTTPVTSKRKSDVRSIESVEEVVLGQKRQSQELDAKQAASKRKSLREASTNDSVVDSTNDSFDEGESENQIEIEEIVVDDEDMDDSVTEGTSGKRKCQGDNGASPKKRKASRDAQVKESEEEESDDDDDVEEVDNDGVAEVENGESDDDVEEVDNNGVAEVENGESDDDVEEVDNDGVAEVEVDHKVETIEEALEKFRREKAMTLLDAKRKKAIERKKRRRARKRQFAKENAQAGQGANKTGLKNLNSRQPLTAEETKQPLTAEETKQPLTAEEKEIRILDRILEKKRLKKEKWVHRLAQLKAAAAERKKGEKREKKAENRILFDAIRAAAGVSAPKKKKKHRIRSRKGKRDERKEERSNDDSPDIHLADIVAKLDEITQPDADAGVLKERNDEVDDIGRGKAKSGRWWKETKDKFSTMVKTPGLRRPHSEKEKLRSEIKHNKEMTRHILETAARLKEEHRQRRAENIRRKEENAKKAEIVQVIKNPAKLKRMRKKQLRLIEKRDTLPIVEKKKKKTDATDV